jgi:hypothetical protein
MCVCAYVNHTDIDTLPCSPHYVYDCPNPNLLLRLPVLCWTKQRLRPVVERLGPRMPTGHVPEWSWGIVHNQCDCSYQPHTGMSYVEHITTEIPRPEITRACRPCSTRILTRARAAWPLTTDASMSLLTTEIALARPPRSHAQPHTAPVSSVKTSTTTDHYQFAVSRTCTLGTAVLCKYCRRVRIWRVIVVVRCQASFQLFSS